MAFEVRRCWFESDLVRSFAAVAARDRIAGKVASPTGGENPEVLGARKPQRTDAPPGTPILDRVHPRLGKSIDSFENIFCHLANPIRQNLRMFKV